MACFSPLYNKNSVPAPGLTPGNIVIVHGNVVGWVEVRNPPKDQKSCNPCSSGQGNGAAVPPAVSSFKAASDDVAHRHFLIYGSNIRK
jgi:hypothetical protein